MDMICAERTPSYHIGVHQMNALNSQTFHINQILNIKQLIEITGLSRATIYSLLDPKSKYYDTHFPKHVVRYIGWSAGKPSSRESYILICPINCKARKYAK